VISPTESHLDKPLVSFLVIATRGYTKYANDLINSISSHVLTGKQIEIIVFTDNLDAIANVERENLFLKRIQIPDLGWPDATLLRYQIFDENKSSITGQIIVYLDADTIIKAPITEHLLSVESWENGIALVRHPGYFNRNFLFAFLMRLRAGPFENRRKSQAYVPFVRRRKYVCGGVWMGLRDPLLKMISQLRRQVELDQSIDIIAKHHDESHLNAWRVRNKATLLQPVWAFAPGYKNLKHLKPIIEVVHKPSDWIKD
jgi:hypothetical protein